LRYGIFSDVHGNIDALGEVLTVLEEANVDEYVCLGDVVGYGANPEECCKRIGELSLVTILGNHDAAVAGRMDYSYYYDAAKQALELHTEWISAESMEWLRSLPYSHTVDEHGITFCHGSPVNKEEFEYVFAVEQAKALCPFWDELSDVTFIGHSHLTKSFALTEEGAVEISGDGFDLDEGKKYIITVGSVGQPRDYDARSCCGVYDTETRRFEFRRVPYDVHVQAEKILDGGLAQSFAKRLFLGV
jgi:diadenosine tetraphosphatase ApaH/serine/threonine PP2A family protein phosphatase